MRTLTLAGIVILLTVGCDSNGTATRAADTQSTTPDTATSSDVADATDTSTSTDGAACVEGVSEGKPCDSDNDCARPMLCSTTRKTCQPPYTCTNDESCVDAPGRICVDHFCALAECSADNDCHVVCRTTCNQGACE